MVKDPLQLFILEWTEYIYVICCVQTFMDGYVFMWLLWLYYIVKPPSERHEFCFIGAIVFVGVLIKNILNNNPRVYSFCKY